MVNFKRDGQAATELAIFGAIIIFVLGAIVRSAVTSGQSQDTSLKIMRYALLQSYQTTNKATNRSSASVLYIQDHLSPDFGKHGALDRTPTIAQGSGTLTNMLMYPVDPDELQDPQHLPVTDVIINGKKFNFSTGRLVYKKLDLYLAPWGPVQLPPTHTPTIQTFDVTVACPDKNDLSKCKATPGAALEPMADWNGLFSKIVVNNGAIEETFNVNSIGKGDQAQIDIEKHNQKFCITQCYGGENEAKKRFDLNRNGTFTDDPGALGQISRSQVAWQYRYITPSKALTGKELALYWDPTNGIYPSWDVDGDGSEETIYLIDYKPTNPAVYDPKAGTEIVGVTVFDSTKGDFDFNITDPSKAPGLMNDSRVMTTPSAGAQKGNYLYMRQDKGIASATSVNAKEQTDMIERMVRLSNDTGRMCPVTSTATVNVNSAQFTACINACTNPTCIQTCNIKWPGTATVAVTAAAGGDIDYCSSTGECTNPANIKGISTCFEQDTKILYVRTPLTDKSGHFWKNGHIEAVAIMRAYLMNRDGQSTLEFIFAMVAVMFLIYGTVQVFRWVGMDLAQRRWANDSALIDATKNTEEKLSSGNYHPARLNAMPNMGLK